ncbi:MAG TPA: PAS domain S-box protein [Bryobacteraceae bacterium]|nr:PAS domain S-box protein [Bryobacteraceae bacterium]
MDAPRAPDFRALFDALPSPHLVCRPEDPTYTIVAANHACSEITRGTAQEVVGRQLPDVFAGDPDGIRDSMRRVVATKKTQTTTLGPWSAAASPLLRRDGEVEFVVLRLDPIPAPQHQDARYRMVFQDAPIGMVLLDPEGRISEVNQTYVDTFGYSREELASRDSSFYTHPDDIQRTTDFFASLRNGPQGRSSIEKRYLRKGGQVFWTRASATLRRDEQGRPAEVIAVVEDITERKLAEERLWESQAQLRAIYDGTYEYIGLLALDGTLLDCNRASLQFANSRREDVVGLPFWNTVWFAHTPGVSDAVREGVALAAAGQFVRHEALALTRPSGSVVIFDFSLHPVRNERGEVVFIVPEGRDITEQNRAARQIGEDRRRWRELLKQAPAGIAVLHGPEHRFDWVNPDYELIVGRSAEALIGRTVLEAVPEVKGQEYIHILDRVYQTGKPFHGHEAPILLRRTDGSPEIIYINFVYLPTRDVDGRIDGIFVHVTDVTSTVMARKRAEESEQRFRQLADSMPQIVWTARADGYIDYCNKRWHDFTGLDCSVEKVQSRLAIVHPDEAKRVEELWKRSLRSGEPFQTEARLWDRHANRWRWFMIRAVSVRDESGEVVKWFGTDTDIDEQKASQQALLQTQKLESIGLLAGGIAHDFNNLLAGIMGGASFALEIIPESHPAFEVLQMVLDASERAAHLTRQMLAYAGKGNFVVAPVDLSQMIVRTIQFVRASIPKSIEIKLDFADRLPAVEADPGQMQQVVMNLIINAAESVGENNGVVTVRTRTGELAADAVHRTIDGNPLPAGSYVILEVQDTGCGIDPSILAKIFDPFFTTKFTGRGLGLAAVAGVIRGHRGGIDVESECGKGSTFRVWLPASPHPSRSTSSLADAGSAPHGHETVLVVDDEPVVRQVAITALSALGYQVIVSEDGSEGLDQIRRNPGISLVLLDMSMPGLSGREVLEEIRATRPELPVVVCSGYSEVEVHRRFAGIEMADILQKPFTARELTTKVRSVLDAGAHRAG